MKDINEVANIPEVLAAVLSDPAGALVDAVGDVDGESAGAVHAYSMRALCQAGELLGLGAFEHATIVGQTKACVISLDDDRVLGVYASPGKAIAAVEKRLEGAPGR